MNFLHKAFHYLDKGQHKRTNMVTVCVLCLCVVFILFVPFIITLLQTRKYIQGVHFATPIEFALSTLIILYSTWVVKRLKLHKERDDNHKLRRSLLTIFCLGLLFLLTQYVGWQEVLASKDYRLTKIVIVIVAVHAIHFFIALILVGLLIIRTAQIKSPADAYIFFLNPTHNLFFKSAFLYWDYMGFLWAGLYLIMLVKGI